MAPDGLSFAVYRHVLSETASLTIHQRDTDGGNDEESKRQTVETRLV